MPYCSRCKTAHAFHELTNFDTPAPKEKGAPDPVERLCLRCVAEELERVKKQAAAMREALEGVLNSAVHPDVAVRTVIVPLDPIRKALSYDAGRDYLSREQVKPLVEALKAIEARHPTFHGTNLAQIRQAPAHATQHGEGG